MSIKNPPKDFLYKTPSLDAVKLREFKERLDSISNRQDGARSTTERDTIIAEKDAELARLRARVAELEAAQSWRPISEAPKDGTRILMFVPTYKNMFVVRWDAAWGCFATDSGNFAGPDPYQGYPGYKWRHAPEPPK